MFSEGKLVTNMAYIIKGFTYLLTMNCMSSTTGWHITALNSIVIIRNSFYWPNL